MTKANWQKEKQQQQTKGIPRLGENAGVTRGNREEERNSGGGKKESCGTFQGAGSLGEAQAAS